MSPSTNLVQRGSTCWLGADKTTSGEALDLLHHIEAEHASFLREAADVRRQMAAEARNLLLALRVVMSQNG